MSAFAKFKKFVFPEIKFGKGGTPPGLYHYSQENVSEGQVVRFHLRVEPEGDGLLIVNASYLVRLSPSGVEYARAVLEGKEPSQIKKIIENIYEGLSPSELGKDLETVRKVIEEPSKRGWRAPIVNFDDPAFADDRPNLIAPLGADIAFSNLETLLPIIDALWRAKVPQLTLHLPFTVPPEVFSSKELISVIERAESKGMIVGVRTTGSFLSDNELLTSIANAGVDYVELIYLSEQAPVHDSFIEKGDHSRTIEVFKSLRELDVCPVAQVALVPETIETLDKTLEGLIAMGVKDALFFAVASAEEKFASEALVGQALRDVAALIEDESVDADVRYVFQAPVRRNGLSNLNEQVMQGPRCSSDLSIRIVNDGMVVPPRGVFESAGNILKDDWSSIWGHRCFKKYRELAESSTRCESCPGLAICAVDCPAKEDGWT